MSGWGSIIQSTGGGGGSGSETVIVGQSQIPSDTSTPDPGVEVYGEALSVASGSETTILSYIVPPGVFHLLRVELSGTNIGTFNLYYDSVRMNRLVTYYGGNLSGAWEYFSGAGGMEVPAGTVIQVKVLHSRPYPGDFTARIQGKFIN